MKASPGRNTLAYWASSQVTIKIKCCEYGPRDRIHNTIFFVTYALFGYTSLERLTSEKICSLLCPFLNKEENIVIEYDS
jgi:hypothetical protein